MVERFTAHFGSFNINLQVFLCFRLADVIRHAFRPQRVLRIILRELPRRNDALIIGHTAGKFDTQTYTPLLFDQLFQALADDFLRLQIGGVQPFHRVQRLGLRISKHHERGDCFLRVVDAAAHRSGHHRR